MAGRKQVVNMSDSLEVIDGVGKKSIEVFLHADFKTIEDLKKEIVGYRQHIQQAIDGLKKEKPHFKALY